jgi:hypothetical protein
MNDTKPFYACPSEERFDLGYVVPTLMPSYLVVFSVENHMSGDIDCHQAIGFQMCERRF